MIEREIKTYYIEEILLFCFIFLLKASLKSSKLHPNNTIHHEFYVSYPIPFV